MTAPTVKYVQPVVAAQNISQSQMGELVKGSCANQ